MPYRRLAIRQFMSTDFITFNPDMDILQAIHVLLNNQISGAPVVDATGELIGMLTEKDFMKVALDAAFNQQSGGTVADFMTPDVVSIPAEEPIIDTVKRFYEGGYLRYPVVDGTGLVGVVSRSEVLQAIGKYWNFAWESVEV